jgi:hypothetical protein
MENIRLLFRLYFRPASAISDIIDNGSWLFAAVLVLLVSMAFFATVNVRLDEAYRIPALGEFYHPEYSKADEDSPAAEAEYNKAIGEYQKALAEHPRIPLIGDYFFRFFSFDPAAPYKPLLLISIFYVPAVILLMSFLGGAGSFGIVLQRDYGALAVCTLMAWAAAHLPFAIVGGVLIYLFDMPPQVLFGMWAASGLLFGVFMIFVLRTVFGANY